MQFTVLTDRAQGGTSLNDGEVELMVCWRGKEGEGGADGMLEGEGRVDMLEGGEGEGLGRWSIVVCSVRGGVEGWR